MNEAALTSTSLAGQGRHPAPLWLLAALLFALSIIVAPRASAGEDEIPVPTSPIGDLETLQRAFQAVVADVAPSVVGLRAQRRHVASLAGANAPGDAGAEEQRIVVNGCGTILTEDGLILTNEHVIQAASDIDVLFHDGQKLHAIVVAADPRSDLAILQVPRSGLRPVRICNWEMVARGQWSVVLGNPFGLGADGQLSVSVGVIANLGRQLPGLGEVDDRFYNDMIQVTAPIHPGNSGGPLFNIRGELIGIVTAMHTRAPADEGVGFAIPMTPAKVRLVDGLCKGRPIEYGYIGLTVRTPEPADREALPGPYGVVVQRIEPDGPASHAGLRVGDILLEYEQQPVTGPAHLAELAGQSPIGTIVRVDYLRAGRPASVSLTVAQRDVNRVGWMRSQAVAWRGMRLADLSEDARRRMHLEPAARGVVVTEVDVDSPADQAHLKVGDVLDEVGGQPIESTLDFLVRVRAVKGTLIISVRNAGKRAVTP